MAETLAPLNLKPNRPPMKPPNRKKRVKPQSAKPSETDLLKKKNQARWVEALIAVEKQLQKVEKQLEETLAETTATGQKTRIIHIFAREGDIAPCLRPDASDRTNWSYSQGSS